MNNKNARQCLIGFAAAFFVICVSADAFSGSSISIQWGQESQDGDSHEVNKSKKGGPPAHAPAHGYRAKRQYRYYPTNSVYYDSDRKLYFYLKGENWEVGASLPSKLKASLGDFVNFELETDDPYVYHEEHVKKYPPGKSKKKKNRKHAQKKKK
jgi:hypothetical protein